MTELFDEREPSEQIAGRFVGIAVFLAGIILLVLTFALAYHGFHDTDFLLPRQTLRATLPSHRLCVTRAPVYCSFCCW